MTSEARRINVKVLIGYLLGSLFYVACLYIAWVIETWWLNVAICLFGFGLGWNAGMLLSPKDATQKREFVFLFGTTFLFGMQSTYIGRRYSMWIE